MTITLEYDLDLGDIGKHLALVLCMISRNVVNDLSLDVEQVLVNFDGVMFNAAPFIQHDKLIQMRADLKNRYWCEMVPMLKSNGEIVA